MASHLDLPGAQQLSGKAMAGAQRGTSGSHLRPPAAACISSHGAPLGWTSVSKATDGG